MATENPPADSSSDPPTTQQGNEGDSSSGPGTPATRKGPPSPSRRKHKYYKPVGNKPSTARADRLIIMAMAGTLGVVVLGHFSGEKTLNSPGEVFRTSAGTIIAGTMLLVVAEAEPELAIMIAFLILMGTLLVHGDVLAKVMANVTNAKPANKVWDVPSNQFIDPRNEVPSTPRKPTSVPIAPVFPKMNV